EKKLTSPETANAEARRDAAKKVYEETWDLHMQSVEWAPGNVEYYHDWSVRWLQAERDLSRTKAEEIEALGRHLKRMQTCRERLDRIMKLRSHPSAADFFCFEAANWLAVAKAADR